MPQTLIPPQAPDHLEEEALFPEARRLRRRRWALGVSVVVLALLIVVGVIAVLSANTKGSRRASDFVAGPLRAGAIARLHVAGALAVGPGGELYVADVNNSQKTGEIPDATRVLVRLPDGRFRLVVSNLPGISDLAFAPDGTLYIADAGWVRAVGHNGEIRTIAGDGRAEPRRRSTGVPRNIPAGTPARSAALGSIQSTTRRGNPLHIAFSPSGQLYISTGTQILRLTTNGTLDPLKATVKPRGRLPGGPLSGFGPIAVAPNGTIYVGGGNFGWTLWAVNPNGTTHYLGYARQSGGNYVVVQRAPNGAIYTEHGGGLQQIEAGRRKTVFEFTQRLDGQYFPLTNFALAPHGVIYADDIPGNQGFEDHQQLVAVHRNKLTLLWQERNQTPH